jgi:hypothetical protein
MADVRVSLGEQTLRREEQGITFTVEQRSARLGELTISKGGLRWLSANEKEAGGHHFASWADLKAFMDSKPRK